MVKYFKLLVLVVMCTLCSCCQSDKPLYRIQENGFYGFVDSTGTVVIEPQYKYVSSFNYYGYATVITEYSLKEEKSEFGRIDTLLHIKYGFIDKSNTLIVDTTHVLNMSLAQLQQLDMHQIYKVCVEKFEKGELGFNDCIDGGAIQLRAGQYVVQNAKNKLMGYMNLQGDTTIAAKYEACNPMYGGVAIVSRVRDMSSIENFIDDLNSTIIIDSLGNELTKDRYFVIPNFAGLEQSWSCKIIKDEEGNIDFSWLLLDKQGKVCSDTVRCTHVYNSNSDVYIWKQNLFETPVYSYIDKKGNWLTDLNHDGSISFFEETFNDVTAFSDTIAGVRVRYNEIPCWVFINKKMEYISEPYDSVFTFRENLVAVKEFSTDKKNTKWGFVNKEFKEVIPYKYDKVSSFAEGLAYFMVGNIEGYINRTGKVVWSHLMK